MLGIGRSDSLPLYSKTGGHLPTVRSKLIHSSSEMKGMIFLFGYIWPVALVVLSNTVYQICTKDVPGNVSPFASLTVTYLVGAAFSALLHYVTHPGDSILKQITYMNWTSYVLGLVIVGLEVGWIYAYKAGWQVSTGSIVQSAFLALALIFVGAVLYREPITWNKVLGIAICLVGLVFINIK